MFFDDPVAALANARRALKPGGRMVFVCWQDLTRNDWIMIPTSAALQHVPMLDLTELDGPGPFFLPTPPESAGFWTRRPSPTSLSRKLCSRSDWEIRSMMRLYFQDTEIAGAL